MWRHALIGSKLALFCLVGGVAIACVQTYETDIRGKAVEPAGYGASEVILAHQERAELHSRLKNLKVEFESSSPVTDYKERNDYAVVLMSLGETEKAIEILKSIESERPNEYNTAANLGTAFELHGDLANALNWIKIGIERNPKAHEGTEWLHVKILEAEIALERDPDWLASHSVLGLDFGYRAKPNTPRIQLTGNTGQQLTKDNVLSALRFQLKERVGLVPPSNAVVADLLGDLANMIALNVSLEQAIPVYELAIEYDPADPTILESRLLRAQRLVAANPDSDYASPGSDVLRSILIATVIGFVVVVSAIGLGRYLAQRRIRKAAAEK